MNESVELTKKHCKNPRRRRPGQRHPAEPGPEHQRASGSGSQQPDGLSLPAVQPPPVAGARTWAKELDGEELETLLRWDNSEPPVTVQVNTCRFETPKVVLALEREGVNVPAPPLAAGLPGPVTDTGDLSPAHGLAGGDVLSPGPRRPPGGPGRRAYSRGMTRFGCLRRPRRQVLCRRDRVWRIRARSTPATSTPIKKRSSKPGPPAWACSPSPPRSLDGKKPRKGWEERFDAVLADVPCSGLGVIRKKPEIRYKDPAELAGLPQIQGDILDNVSPLCEARRRPALFYLHAAAGGKTKAL